MTPVGHARFHHERCFRRILRSGHLHLSQPCRASRRDSCPSSPTRGSSTACAAPSMSQALRPSSVDLASPILVELALFPSDRSTRNRPPLAAPSFRLVLGTEIAACSRKTRGESGDSRSDSEHEPSQPLVGAPRIHGELLKLGIEVAQSTVAKYLPRPRKPPSQTWRTFLTNHLAQTVAIDFFTVPTATFRVLFVFVALSHERRRVVH